VNTNPIFVLVHGNWHDGSSWSDVAQHLRDAGFRSVAPTLPGHGRGEQRGGLRHRDYVDSVVDEVDRLAGDVVLVGHSFGGSVVSRVADLRPERCRLLVYYAAFVPRDGESVADSLPMEFIAFLDEAVAASPDGLVSLPREVFAAAFANTADAATVDAIHARLVPEPPGPIFEPLSLPRFEGLGIPTAYIACRQDLTLPPGTFHPGQSSRLASPQLIEIDGDHEALYTAPRDLAWALLEAIGAGGDLPLEPVGITRP